MRNSELRGERSSGNYGPGLVIICLFLVEATAIQAQPPRPATDSVKKRTISAAAIKDPCQALEQKLSELQTEKAQLESKIAQLQSQINEPGHKNIQDLADAKEELKQVEEKIKTTQAALDECRKKNSKGGTSDTGSTAAVATGVAHACPTGEEWPSPGPSATIWEDKAAALRHIDGNGIPNHCVKPDDYYHAPMKEQHYHFKVPLSPELPKAKGAPTPVTVCPQPFSQPPQRFGVALNSVPFDPEDVAIWTQTASKGCGGAKKVDCIDNIPPGGANDCPPNKVRWQLDAATPATIADTYMCCDEADLLMDGHTGHTQNEQKGIYHYHTISQETAAYIAGINKTSLDSPRVTLVGWAFDGFPVYWKYGQLKPEGDVITMVSGWTASENVRSKAAKAGGAPVPNDFDKYPAGTFVNDYEYAKAKGDGALDECNGTECYSPELDTITYCYFITEKFPYIPRCFRGTPTEK